MVAMEKGSGAEQEVCQTLHMSSRESKDVDEHQPLSPNSRERTPNNTKQQVSTHNERANKQLALFPPSQLSHTFPNS